MEAVASPPAQPAVRPAINSPYPGLRPFQPDDSEYFFGREQQVRDVIATLRSKRFVAIIGGSGSGKSSLVLAGAIPRLRSFVLEDTSDFWVAVVSTPGTNHPEGDGPLCRLARKFCTLLKPCEDSRERTANCVRLLQQPRGFSALIERYGNDLKDTEGVNLALRPPNYLFLVDQFEELFHPSNVSPDVASQSTALVERIVEQSDSELRHARVCLALTMRSEHLNNCPRYTDLPDAINGAFFLVKRPDHAQLRESIEKPAMRYLRSYAARARRLEEYPDLPDEIAFDPDLIARLLADSDRVLKQVDHADQLPLLQHLLFRLWAAATRRCAGMAVPDRLTLADLAVAVCPGRPLDASINTLQACLEYHCEAIYLHHEDRVEHWKLAFQGLAFRDPNTGAYTQQRESRASLTRRLGLRGEPDTALHDYFEPWLEPHKYLHWDSNSTTLKVAHETLIRRWTRLRGWIDEQDVQFVLYRRLLDDTNLWLRSRPREAFLSSGASLTNYELNGLQAAIEDPVQLGRLERLMGMVRSDAKEATSELALQFLKASIDARQTALDAEHDRARKEELEREQAAEARHRADVARAQAKAARSRQRYLLTAMALGTVVVGAVLLVALGDSMLSAKERKLHIAYALAAETSGGMSPQFRSYEQQQVPLRVALLGAHYFFAGRNESIGPAGYPLIDRVFSGRRSSLDKAQILAAARSIGALQGALQGAAWVLAAPAEQTPGAVPMQGGLKCVDVQPPVANEGPVEAFLPPSARGHSRGLLLAPGKNGTTVYAGDRTAAGTCYRGVQVASFPAHTRTIGISADLSNLVVGLEGMVAGVDDRPPETQYYAMHWLNPTNVYAVMRASVLETLDLPPGNTMLPTRRTRDAVDLTIGAHTVRLFDVEPVMIAPAEVSGEGMVLAAKNDPCIGIGEDASGDRPPPQIWSLPHLTKSGGKLCLSVSQAGAGGARYVASLYRVDPAVGGLGDGRQLPLTANIELGDTPPSEFRLDGEKGTLAFHVPMAESWGSMPFGLRAFQSLGQDIYRSARRGKLAGDLPTLQRAADLIAPGEESLDDAELLRSPR